MFRSFGLIPVVWPDESLFAQPAMLLIREGRLASPLLTGSAAGAAERTYWYPPGFFLVVAGGFALTGPVLATMRAISLAAAVAVLALTWALARRISVRRPAAALAIGLLALDPVFGRASLVGRSDLVAVALILVTILLVTGPGGRRTDAANGGVSALALLIHPYGAMALLVALLRPVVRPPAHWAATIAGAILPLIPWAAYLLQDPASLVDQLSLTFARHDAVRSLDPGAVLRGINDQFGDDRTPVVPLAWLLGAAGLALATRHERRALPGLVAFGLGSLATVWTQQMWHPVYVVPFMYVGIALLAERLATSAGASAARVDPRRLWRAAMIGATLSVVGALVALDVGQVAFRADVASKVRIGAYGEWTRGIAATLPAGSRVLIGGVPDPAFGLFERADLRLVALQDAPRSLAYWYDRIGADIDYVVLASSVPEPWLDLIRARADPVRRVAIETGDDMHRPCPDWMPCGTFGAQVYRVRSSGAIR